MVVRLGGDEFAVVADVQQRDDVQALVASIRDSFLRPFSVLGHLLHVTVSIGISVYPSDDIEIEHLLRNADAAMYQAKSDGRNTFAFFTDDLRMTAVNRLAIEADLRLALKRGEFELYFQPVLDLRSGATTAAEGLLRWNHPKRGVVLPAEFIGIAEESGLIVPIGDVVLTKGAQQARRLTMLSDRSCSISVNVSGRQLHDPNFAEHVREALGEYTMPLALGIEITESTALGDPRRAADVLEKCKELGLSILLDDFGTHYASLTYLKVLPIDVIKIDKSFVDGLPGDSNDTGIVKAIIALGQGSGAKVIAEGVETEGQARWLLANGCLYASGYFFAAPMQAEDFEAWIAQGRNAEAD